MMTFRPVFLSLLRWLMVALCGVGFAQAKVIYVKMGAEPGDGSSWKSAFSDLRQAMFYSRPGDELWVAQGVYWPSKDDQTLQFFLKKNVRLYGGFRGDESSRKEAAPKAYVTVMSGDINRDDVVDEHGITLSYEDQGEKGGNCINSVVRIVDGVDVLIDGFTICGGDARMTGGGVSCLENSSVTISRCVIRGNRSQIGGGVSVSHQSILIIRDSQILQNKVQASKEKSGNGIGGGIAVNGDSVLIEWCWIAGNYADFRGAESRWINPEQLLR